MKVSKGEIIFLITFTFTGIVVGKINYQIAPPIDSLAWDVQSQVYSEEMLAIKQDAYNACKDAANLMSNAVIYFYDDGKEYYCGLIKGWETSKFDYFEKMQEGHILHFNLRYKKKSTARKEGSIN